MYKIFLLSLLKTLFFPWKTVLSELINFKFPYTYHTKDNVQTALHLGHPMFCAIWMALTKQKPITKYKLGESLPSQFITIVVKDSLLFS